MHMKLLKDRIAKVMQITGWSATKVSEQAGVSKGAVTHWKKGATEELKAQSAKKLSKESGFCVNWLIDGSGPMMEAGSDGRGPIRVATITPSLETHLRGLGGYLAQLSEKGHGHAKDALSRLVDSPGDAAEVAATIQAQINLANANAEAGRQQQSTSSGKQG